MRCIYMLCLPLLLVAGVKAQSYKYYLPKPALIDSGRFYLRARTIWRARKRVYGGHIILGNRVISARNNRWSTEVYWGLGIHYKEEWLPNEEPNSGYVMELNMLIRQSVYAGRKHTQVLPSMPFGFRWVYAIR